MRKRIISLILTFVMVLGLLPTVALAAGTDQVHVIVENKTYDTTAGAAWDGTLVDEWVDLTNESTMMSCVVDALTKNGYTQTGAESNYITEINELSAGDGGTMSGWMGSLNDWFANEGFAAFTAASGKLKAGDEIRIMYTCDLGADLGSDWNSTDKTVKAVSFSAGELNETFDKDTREYTLTVPANVSELTVTPTASNKNFQVRTFVDSTEYQRTAAIPVENGTVITVKCGDPDWPSMNSNDDPAQVYTFTVSKPISVTGVSLNKTSLALEVDDSEQLTATVQPGNAGNKSIAWSSSDASVASVADDGTVKALAVGTAAITATTADGAKTASCSVTVTAVPTETVTVTVKAAPKTVNVSFFHGDGTLQLPSARVTDNGVVGNYHQYTLEVPAGEYAYRGTDGETELGGEQFTVTEEKTQTVNLLRANIRYNGASLNQEGDYSFTFKNGENDVVCGEPYVLSNIRYTPTLLIAGAEHRGTVALAEKNLDEFYLSGSGEGEDGFTNTPSTTAGSAADIKLPITQYMMIRVTAPSDAETTFYKQNNNFNVSPVTPDSQSSADGMTTYLFKGTAAHSNYEYRVSKAGKVTQAGYLKDGDNLTVTFPEERTPTDTTSTLAYDDNSVLLNINAQNELNLAVGGTFKLRAYRAAWEIINTTTGNIMIEPDFHYAIFSGSDVISIEEAPQSSETGSCNGNATGNWMEITAKKAGTAIVAVYYDALDVYGAIPSNAAGITTFGATDPARYGVFVVNVGDNSSVPWNPVSQDGDWDAEFDTVYYTGDSGTFAFKPTSTASSVTVQNLYGATLSAAKAVAVGTDGTYAVPVTTGANIVAVTTAEGTDYQIVRAKKIDYTIKNNTTGYSAVNAAPAIKTGDSVTISFDKLDMPIPKVSGIYNPGYMGTAKTAYLLNGKYVLTSAGTQYDFSTKNDITFTAHVVGTNTLQEGYISLSSMGSDFGAHRGIPDKGVSTNKNAAEKFGSFGVLPEIAFSVDADSEYTYDTDELTKLTGLQLYVGLSEYNVGIDKKISDVNGNVISTWKNPTAAMGLHVKATAASYLSQLQLRYWYEGEQPKTVDLTSGFESVLSGSDFTPDGTKLLNLQILVTPPAGMGEAKAYNYVILGGTENQKYVHPVIKTLSVSSEGKTLALTPAVDCLCTEYELDADNVTSINLVGTQEIKLYNTSTAADMSDSVVLTKMKSGSQVGESVTILEAGLPNNPNRNWTCSNIDIENVDTLKLTVTSYVDDTIKREYTIKIHTWGDGTVETPATCTETGTLALKCLYCDKTKTKEIPALGHTYGAYSYAWNENNQCTATRTCSVCPEGTKGHTDTETKAGDYVKDTEATCTTPEKGHYEAVFGETKLSTAKDSAIGSASGHRFTEWVPEEDHFTSTCKRDGCNEKISSVSASVDFTAQAKGAFLCAPQTNVAVDSSLAERYGYSDSVPASEHVSALDVLVKAHEVIFGGDFTKETAADYLNPGSGFVTKLFGIGTSNNGFAVNRGTPNDGTDSSYGGYNGYTINTAPISSGDLAEFFVYQDNNAMDNYSFVSCPETVSVGTPFTVNVKGISIVWNGYLHQTPADFKAAAEPLEGISIGTVDPETGAVTDLKVTTDENGDVQIKLDKPGTYWLTACGTDGSKIPVIMTVEAVTEAGWNVAYKDVLKKTLKQLAIDVPNPSMGFVKGEWTVLALARGGEIETGSTYFEDYYESLADEVKTKAYASGRLDQNKSTENSRVIMALSSIGKDAHDVGGVDLIAPYADFNWVQEQGINGPIFALIALDTVGYETEDTTIRQQCIDFILENQLADGGWNLSGNTADPDMTAMALQALAAYQSDEKAAAAAQKAFDYLSNVQSSGDFGTAETNAQYITACAAWGRDAEATVNALLGYYLEDTKNFLHIKDREANAMATDQAAYALVAYDRMKNGKKRLYDMTDVEMEQKEQAYDELLEELEKLADSVSDAKQATYRKVQDAQDDFDDFEKTDEYKERTNDEKKALQDALDDVLKTYEDKLDDAKAEQNKKLLDSYLDIDQSELSADAVKELNKLYNEALAAIEAGLYEEQLASIVEKAAEEMENVGKKIRVTFRLIGCEQAEQSVNLSASSYLPEYITWIPTERYELKKDSTVYDLLLKALAENGLSQRGASANYVESISAPSILGGFWLGEFDNGAKSGWMFTVNGSHPTVGLKDRKLKDGDTVIWHYVNDYANEVSDWIGSSTGSSATYNGWLRARDITPVQYVKEHLNKIVTVHGKGDVSPELKYTDLGRKVTFTFTPAAGQKIKEVVVNGVSKGIITSYTVNNLSFTDRIEVWFTGSELPFIDVYENDWFYDDVVFAYENGLFSGTSDDRFSPAAPMTRAMLMTVLYRLEGSPWVTGTDSFTDTGKNTWYSDAIVWAVKAGIIKGTSPTTFSPDADVTREQMAAILYRYAEYKGYDTRKTASLTAYTDDDKISAYARDSFAWANASGLITGIGRSLDPTGNATRAQVAAILHRFCENVVK